MPDLNALLAPRSIAVVGASPDPTIIRGRVLNTLKERRFPGAIYPISRSHAEVQGIKAYASIADLPKVPDLAILIIPAAGVPEALHECGRAGIKAAYIISSGFSEARGEAGAKLQARIREIALRHGMAVCGPNAEGFFNEAASVCATFSPGVEKFEEPLRPTIGNARPIGVVSQSGGLGFSFYQRARPRHYRFSYTISTGNEAALEGFDLVAHMIDEGKTEIVLMYLEAVRDGALFRHTAARAADAKVPLIVAKMGRSEVGRLAARSHTAALAGSDSAYDALFRHYGIARADSMDSMLAIAGAFAFSPLPTGGRVGIMSGSGGAAVWMSDTLVAHGLDVPELDARTRRAIDAVIPSYGASRNPVDLTAQVIRQVGYARITEIMLRSPRIDSVVIVGSLANTHTLEQAKDELKRIRAQYKKPVLFCTYTLASQAAVDLLADVGLPCYTDMQDCALALKALVDYGAFQARWRKRAAPQRTRPVARARAGLAAAGPVLCEYQAKALLAPYGVPAGHETLVKSPAAALKAAAALGYPVALKVQSPDIPHKTEAGALALNLGSAGAVRTAFAHILAKAKQAHRKADIHGVLVQPMAAKGVEMILGISRDATFGPLLMVGLGGVQAELLRDVAFAPLPLGPDDARRLIQRLKGAALLDGFRGSPVADVAALIKLMVGVARFAHDFADQVEEVDLNPVIVHAKGNGLSVVDALIVKR
ncbi:MAG: CoA-binding protein [Alphaproteobacteria bacterium]|nr:CoA-binding protein [Alphaproteobacteria bacterium]